MPNKNSIESEIANIDFSITVKHYDIPLQEFKITELRLVLKERARKEIKALIQREVKKGRVEEWERVLEAKVTHGGTPGFFNPEGLPIETSRTQQLTEVMQRYAKDRLEELENETSN